MLLTVASAVAVASGVDVAYGVLIAFAVGLSVGLAAGGVRSALRVEVAVAMVTRRAGSAAPRPRMANHPPIANPTTTTRIAATRVPARVFTPAPRRFHEPTEPRIAAYSFDTLIERMRVPGCG